MMRALLFIVTAILARHAGPTLSLILSRTPPLLMRPKSTLEKTACTERSPDFWRRSLQNAAVTATRFCSEAIRTRFQRASVSAPDAQNLARDDQVKTEHRAFAIAFGGTVMAASASGPLWSPLRN
jgi:hypothetical protein